jgi:hypothetical protein
MSKTKILDSDPNSIYGASKKLATISVHNMKNPAVLDNNLINLGATPPILPTNPTANQQSNQKLQPSKVSTPIVKNTDVDEFLSKIIEANDVIEKIHIYYIGNNNQRKKYLNDIENEDKEDDLIKWDDEDEDEEDEDEEDEEDEELIPVPPKAE